jgi:ribonuclease BN (tRNA processing enzyme)
VLTLTFLGVGSAFAKRNFQSNALIEAWSTGPDLQEAPDDTLLIDFGTTGPLALNELKGKLGFSYLDHCGITNYPAIRRIFVTHLHSDHIGGLEELVGMNMHCFANAGSGHGLRPQLIGAPEILTSLWEHSLRGGLGIVGQRHADLTDYFDVHAIHPRGAGEPDRFTLLERYAFTLFPTDHIRLAGKYDWPSYGLLVTDGDSDGSICFSGDARFDPRGVGELMAAARLNFHEVQLEDQVEPVHATLAQLRTLPPDVRKKTILYHYGDAWDDDAYSFVADEFAGFARPHQRYVLFG